VGGGNTFVYNDNLPNKQEHRFTEWIVPGEENFVVDGDEFNHEERKFRNKVEDKRKFSDVSSNSIIGLFSSNTKINALNFVKKFFLSPLKNNTKTQNMANPFHKGTDWVPNQKQKKSEPKKKVKRSLAHYKNVVSSMTEEWYPELFKRSRATIRVQEAIRIEDAHEMWEYKGCFEPDKYWDTNNEY